MIRSFMQIYMKNSQEAIPFYEKAFDTKAKIYGTYGDGTILHAELNVYGHVFALAELKDAEPAHGNNMQFCFEFGSGNRKKIKQAYTVLSEDAKQNNGPPGECDYSKYIFTLIDKYGVSWCIFE